jgi:hypothetical protein
VGTPEGFPRPRHKSTLTSESAANSSTEKAKPAESAKPSNAESEDVRNRADRVAADLMAQEVLEGFRQLAKQKGGQKAPTQAA